MIRAVGSLIFCALALASGVASATVTATLDRDQIEIGETVQLQLERDKAGSGKPDLGPLAKDFDVLGTSSGRSVQFINGEISARVQMTITLAPKHEGLLAIPALAWNGERSSPLDLRVVAGGAPGGGADPSGRSGGGRAQATGSPHVFLTGEIDQAKPYVLAPVMLVVRLHTDVPIYQAGMELAGSPDIVVQSVGKDRQFQETREGRKFNIVERRYLLYPQKSGHLSLDGPVLDAQVAQADNDLFGGDPIFGRTFGQMLQRARPLRLHGNAIELDVQPRPAEWTGRDWLPARNVTLEETWQPGNGNVRAGEPLTRHLVLKADGQTGSQLPDLGAQMPLPDGIRSYPDQPKLDSTLVGDALIASREQDVALIAAQPGRYVLPEVRVPWWDTTTNQVREAVLPSRTLEILPGATGTAAAAPQVSLAPAAAPAAAPPASAPSAAGVAANMASDPWRWVSLGLGVLWIATLGGWIATRRRAPAAARPAPAAGRAFDEVSARAALEGFRKACRANAAPDARRHLLAWSRTVWPGQPPGGLREIWRRLDDARLAPLFQELDRACYAGAAWSGSALLEAFQPKVAKPKKGAEKEIAELYP